MIRHRAPRRVALFSHDSQGLGHVRRNIEIAAALVRGRRWSEVLLISGAPAAATLPLPPRTTMVTIPAVRKDSSGGYAAADGDRTLAEVLTDRGRSTAAAIATFEPDLVVVDKHARGLQGELDEMLEQTALLRARGTGPRLVLGLRDVLDDERTAAAEWRRDGVTDTVTTHYDEIWVYGDRHVLDPVEAYGLPAAVAERVRYTGYLARGRGRGLSRAADTAVTAPQRPFVLGLLGGGQDGAELALAFADAPMPRGHLGVLVTGPYLRASARAELERVTARRDDLLVLPFVPSTQPLVRRARAVVTMGGYNTVCEVLAAGSPMLVVPRVRPRREQAVRARLLADRTHLEMLHPALADAAAIGDWLGGAVRRRARPHRVDLDGLGRVSRMADELLRSPAPRFRDQEAVGVPA